MSIQLFHTPTRVFIEGAALQAEPQAKGVLVVLASVLFALQGNVLSDDVWYLALQSARAESAALGVPGAEFDLLVSRLEASRRIQRKRNPMQGMF